MRRFSVGIMAALLVVCSLCWAAYATTPEEAKAMVEKAYAYLRENGKETAFREISNTEGRFVKGDLYVFAMDFKGVILADGGNPGFEGANLVGLKDTNGKYFVKEMIETAKKKGSGWVDYMWFNPATKKIQPKTTYVKRIKGMAAFLACGVLK